MKKQFVVGNRRFTCLSDGLVRMEFSPYKKFEDRRNIICYEKQKPVSFKTIQKKKNKIYLDTGKITIVSSDHDKDFFFFQS